MKKYAIWYDNGSGWFEASSEVDASTAQEAYQNNRSGIRWSPEIVVTAGYDKDPNKSTAYILYPKRS